VPKKICLTTLEMPVC